MNGNLPQGSFCLHSKSSNKLGVPRVTAVSLQASSKPAHNGFNPSVSET
jgi:hypothetical protein